MIIPRRMLFGKLNLTLFRAAESATAFAKLRGNPHVELTHWFHQLWQLDDGDIHRICRHYRIEREEVDQDLIAALSKLPGGASSLQDFSPHVIAAIECAWIAASLEFGAASIRGAWLLLALLRNAELRRVLLGISSAFGRIPVDVLADGLPAIVAGSLEDGEEPHDGSGLSSAVPGDSSHAFAAPQDGKSALESYCSDLTAQALAGKIDPVVGRDSEIRAIVDILLRRRQNNPLLTGDAGVGISGLVNEFYTLLVVADTALTANSLPPGGAEIGAKLKLEAGKLPAPFREVLTALATSGSDKVTQGATVILRKQAQVQFDRIMGLMSLQVGELCRRGVEGRYPLVAVAQDVAVEDFTQLFATGGAADEFFNRYLASFVDNSVRPWRYKSPDSANAMVGAEGLAVGATPAPATVGPTMVGELLKLLAQGGPNLDLFYRAQQIRELFFRDAGGRKMAWKMDLRVQELEPSVTDLIIDIDGQGQRYVHGPVQTFTVNWPGLRGGAMAELTANPRISGATSTVAASGPWALFRLMEKGRIVGTATPGHQSVEFAFDGRKAVLDISAGSQPNPLNSDVLKGFRCSGRPS